MFVHLKGPTEKDGNWFWVFDRAVVRAGLDNVLKCFVVPQAFGISLLLSHPPFLLLFLIIFFFFHHVTHSLLFVF